MSDLNHSILIVEDALPWQETYEEMLASKYKLTFAQTLLEAEELLDSVKYDLAIVDPSLDPNDHTKLDGIKVVKRIATLENPPPVIVITGDYSRVRDDDILIIGFVYRVLEKTASYTELNEAIETALNKNLAENYWLDVSRQTSLMISTYKMLKVFLEQLRHLIAADVAHVLLATEQKNELVIVADTGQDEGRFLNITYSITGRAFRLRTTIYLPDSRDETDYQPVRGTERMYSELAVPIQLNETVYGVLNLESHRLNAFNVQTIELTETFATTILFLMQNQHYQREVRELHLIPSEMLKSALDLDSIWRLILDRGLHLLNANRGILAERLSNSSLLQIKATAPEGLTGQILDKADYISYEVVNSGIGKRVTDVLPNQRVRSEKSVIAVPLRLDDSVGILKFESETPYAFNAEHEKLVLSLADYASLAMRLARQKQELVSLEGMKRQSALAAKLVHRIGNPIRNIRNWIGTIRPNELTAIEELFPNVASVIDEIKGNIPHLTEVINELKQALQRAVLEPKPTDINATIKSTLEMIPATFLTTSSLQPNLPRVFADENLKGVFSEIIDNAMEHMPKGGEISVVSRLVDKGVKVEIKDTGEGISPKVLPYIFSPGLSKKRKATEADGLGLSWCKLYVESCGGRIEATSALGEGSTFTIVLPIYGEESKVSNLLE